MSRTPNPGLLEVEDYRGRIQEILQIVEHRFQLTTAAVLAFSVICGWLTTFIGQYASTPSMAERLPDLLSLVSLLILAVLFALYYAQFALLRTLRLFSSYVSVKNPMGWEGDWKKYKGRIKSESAPKHAGYTKAAGWIFLALCALSFVYPAALIYKFGPPYQNYHFGSWVQIAGAFLSDCCLIYYIWQRTKDPQKFVNEDNLVNAWEAVLGADNSKKTEKPGEQTP